MFFLNQGKLKPHKVEEWIHTPIEDQAEFDAKVEELCELHRSAAALREKDIIVCSVDEKTGIQALEREVSSMKPGKPERQDHEYQRHGTQCLIANLDIATGQIVSPSLGATRTEADFLAHIKKTISQSPESSWIIIMDQLNTHKSESLVRYIAEACGIDDDLGQKGKSGILENMKTRANFLSDENHRIRIVYTPKHSSWLNQIECWFGLLVKRLLKRLVVKSKEELKEKIVAFINYYNKTMAKPFKWLFRGFQESRSN